MTATNILQPALVQGDRWLAPYYFSRAAFSILWVTAALTLGREMPFVAATLLVIYPAWDAIANLLDAKRNGGMKKSPTQALNAAVSGVATAAVAIALESGMHAVLAVFGVWAILSGGFQLATGVRRWRTHGAQWAMILSGAQSALAGVFFIKQASGAVAPGIAAVAPYVAFGAFYFLVSAVWLTIKDARSRSAGTAR